MVDEQGGGPPVALITGGGTGVGAATAMLLARRGYDVAVAYRGSASGAAQTAERCRECGASAIELKCDIARDEDCRAVVAEVIARFGRLDALVNNAGATEVVPMKELEALSGDHFQKLTAINVVGTFQMTRAAAPHLARRPGAVVNVSSTSGLLGIGSSIAYAASKGALNTLTLSLARVLAPIRVNAIAPGVIDTEWMIRSAGDEAFKQTKAHVAKNATLGGLSSPEEIAEAINWLLHAKSVTGEIIRVDAGLTLGR